MDKDYIYRYQLLNQQEEQLDKEIAEFQLKYRIHKRTSIILTIITLLCLIFLNIMCYYYSTWYNNHVNMGEIQCIEWCQGPYTYSSQQTTLPIEYDNEDFICQCTEPMTQGE